MVKIKIPKYEFLDIDLVIFDKDGTLIELHRYWSEMIKMRSDRIVSEFGLNQETRDQLSSAMGVNPITGKLKAEGPVGIKKREVVMDAAIQHLSTIGYENTKNTVDKIFLEVDSLSLKMLDELIYPISGAEKIINNLHSAGCSVAIATTDRVERATIAMKYLGFMDHIDLVVGTDTVNKPKPFPDMIEYALNKLAVKSSASLMIGDSISDIEAGINAKVQGSIGVLTGQTYYEDLKKKTPYIIDSIASLKVLQQ